MAHTQEQINKQLENYAKGFPFLKVVAPATPSNGIKVLNESEQSAAVSAFDAFSGKVLKFVPASGAASRMFKDFFAARDAAAAGESELGKAADKFFDNLEKFPFYDKNILAGKSKLDVLNYLLGGAEQTLNYGKKPKGQLLFHSYEDGPATAFEEHLVEGALYACRDGIVRLHFTVSPEHMDGFKTLFDSVKESYESKYNCKYEISFSVQNPDTDIIAVNADNTPFLTSEGKQLFRPGGHGALIENLGAIEADVIIVKNIDNVVHRRLIDETVKWKKVLGGELIRLRDKSFEYLRALEAAGVGKAESFKHVLMGEKNCDDVKLASLCAEISAFLEDEFCVKVPQELTESGDLNALAAYLFGKLNRPIRTCGMVRNEGEAGGGPFIIADNDGSTSLQILEGAQLDKKDARTPELLAASTHFNPVDLCCSTINYKGEKFNLADFVDPATGFISEKSFEGRVLKAQELPGLWNGSMSNWNTCFIETPLVTFNPVKTLLDLLREEHQ